MNHSASVLRSTSVQENRRPVKSADVAFFFQISQVSVLTYQTKRACSAVAAGIFHLVPGLRRLIDPTSIESYTVQANMLPPLAVPPPAVRPPVVPLPPRRPPRHHRLRWTILSITAVIVILLGTGGWLAYRAISVINTKKLDGTNAQVSFFQQLTHIVTANNQPLQGEADDRVNILLMGYGGPGHDGPYLTDTMIIASYKPSTKQLALISIPRDLVVNIPGYYYRKINSALTDGMYANYPGGGEAFAVKVVSDTLDLPIQYYARIDFQGFEQVINLVGGVDVTVDNSFTDYSFPTDNYGYQTVSFKAGLQHLNGVTALNFARSRHGNNGEGSDFARSKRQQKILEALKQKLLSFGTLSNPKKISDILGALGSHSQTNLEVWEILRLANLLGGISANQVMNQGLDNTPAGLLRDATGTDGAYILVPRDGTYGDVQFLANNIFLIHQAQAEQAHVMVVNATNYTGLGQTVTKSLEDFGLDVVRTVSIKGTTIGQTVTLDAQSGRFASTIDFLNRYKRSQGSITLDQWQTQTGDTTLAGLLTEPVPVTTNANLSQTNTNLASTTVTPTVVLILGQDQPKTTTTSLIPVAATAPKTTTNTTPKSTNTTTSTTKKTTTNTNSTMSTNTNSTLTS